MWCDYRFDQPTCAWWLIRDGILRLGLDVVHEMLEQVSPPAEHKGAALLQLEVVRVQRLHHTTQYMHQGKQLVSMI